MSESLPSGFRRSLFVWRLGDVLGTEGGPEDVVFKARRAGLTDIWVKVGEGAFPFRPNLDGPTGAALDALVTLAAKAGIAISGWHIPCCRTVSEARAEAEMFATITAERSLAGMLIDAEQGPPFFQGDAGTAAAYAAVLAAAKEKLGIPVGVSSHAVPQGRAGWPHILSRLSAVADFCSPQLYGVGAAVTTQDQALDANHGCGLPILPVGPAWLGEGGCSSEAECAEDARSLVVSAQACGLAGVAFWHWAGAPAAFWRALERLA